MSLLIETLGPDVIPNLARSASLIAADAEYLDAQALAELSALGDDGLDVKALTLLPAPIRTRVLHLWIVQLGAPRASLSHRHVLALDALIIDWHGQGAVALPGNIFIRRTDGRLHTGPAR